MESQDDLGKEIQQLIDEGEERGLISEDEGEMLQGIFSFRDTVAREILVPRTDTVGARSDTDIRDIIELIIQSGHSRIPIYQDNIDNIVGILHAKDLLPFWGREKDIDIRSIVRPPYFIPETKKISDVLTDLRDKKSHMAIVIDEYGGTAGILTLEDIIEEIIGEIVDEYDSDQNWIVELDDGSIVVDARLDMEELEDHLDVRFPEGNYESVGGFIINFLGRVPSIDDKVVFDNLEFTVTEADRRKAEKVHIRRLDGALASQRVGEESFH
jgi:magnesium and cobalt transporter